MLESTKTLFSSGAPCSCISMVTGIAIFDWRMAIRRESLPKAKLVRTAGHLKRATSRSWRVTKANWRRRWSLFECPTTILPANNPDEAGKQIAAANPKKRFDSTANRGRGAGALFQSRVPQCDHGRSGGGIGY